MKNNYSAVKIVLSFEDRARLVSYLDVLIAVDKRVSARGKKAGKKTVNKESKQKQISFTRLRPVCAVKSRAGLVFYTNYFMLAQSLLQQLYRGIEAHQHDRHYRSYAQQSNVYYHYPTTF